MTFEGHRLLIFQFLHLQFLPLVSKWSAKILTSVVNLIARYKVHLHLLHDGYDDMNIYPPKDVFLRASSEGHLIFIE